MQTNMYKEWHTFSKQIAHSKEVVEQLSKLYIIIHENVGTMMRKCSTDPRYDPSQEAANHLHFIKDILLRLNRTVEKSLISRYEEQLFTLVSQIEATLKTQNSKANLNLKDLCSTKVDHMKQEHSLKEQLRMSEKRRIRSKSGKHTGRSLGGDNREEYNSLIPEKETHITDQLATCKQNYLKMKEKLQNDMRDQVQVKNNQVFFGNKYKDNNLQKYMRERKDFADLIFAQKTYDQIYDARNQNGFETITKQEIEKTNREGVAAKLFSQFKIKTKFMKSRVKENILNTLFQVKKQLIEEFHQQNVATLKDGNQGGAIALKQILEKTQQSKAKSTSLMMTPKRETPAKTKKLNLAQQARVRYMGASQKVLPRVYETTNWTKKVQLDHHTTLTKTVSQARISNWK